MTVGASLKPAISVETERLVTYLPISSNASSLFTQHPLPSLKRCREICTEVSGNRLDSLWVRLINRILVFFRFPLFSSASVAKFISREVEF